MDLQDWLEKARSHKYIQKIVRGGHTYYIYETPGGKKVTVPSAGAARAEKEAKEKAAAATKKEDLDYQADFGKFAARVAKNMEPGRKYSFREFREKLAPDLMSRDLDALVDKGVVKVVDKEAGGRIVLAEPSKPEKPAEKKAPPLEKPTVTDAAAKVAKPEKGAAQTKTEKKVEKTAKELGTLESQAKAEKVDDKAINLAHDVLGLGIKKQSYDATKKACKTFEDWAKTRGNKQKALAALRDYYQSARAQAKTMLGRVEADERRVTPVKGREKWTRSDLGNARNIRDEIQDTINRIRESGRSDKAKQNQADKKTEKAVSYRLGEANKAQKAIEEILDGAKPYKPLSWDVVKMEQRFDEIAGFYKRAGDTQKEAEYKARAQHASEVRKVLEKKGDPKEARRMVRELVGRGSAEGAAKAIGKAYNQLDRALADLKADNIGPRASSYGLMTNIRKVHEAHRSLANQHNDIGNEGKANKHLEAMAALGAAYKDVSSVGQHEEVDALKRHVDKILSTTKESFRKSETDTGSDLDQWLPESDGETLEKSYYAIKTAYEKQYGSGSWGKIDVPKDVEESEAKAEKLPFGSKIKLSPVEKHRYTEAKRRLAGSLGMPKEGWGLYGRSIVGALKEKEKKKENGEDKTEKSCGKAHKSGDLSGWIEKAEMQDDGKPGKSLQETSTDELEATLAKLKPTDAGAEARIKAIKAELASRGKKDMAKAKDLPSEETSLTPYKARQMLHEGSGGHGRPITEQQRKFFGALGGHLPAPSDKTKKSLADYLGNDRLEKGSGETMYRTETLEKAHYISRERKGDKWVYNYGPKGGGTKPHSKLTPDELVHRGEYHHDKYESALRAEILAEGTEREAGHREEKEHHYNKMREVEKEHGARFGKQYERKKAKEVEKTPSLRTALQTIGSGWGKMDFKDLPETLQQKMYDEGYVKDDAKGYIKLTPKGEKAAGMKKSMGLDDWLDKALPTHEVRMGGPKSDTQGGSQDGGDWEGKGKTPDNNGGPVTAKGLDAQGNVTGSDPGKEDKLSEDDEEQGEIGKPGRKKPIETIGKSELYPAPLTPARQRDMVAHDVAKLRKSPEMVTIGPQNHPYGYNQTMGADVDAMAKSEGSTEIPSLGYHPGQSLAQSQVLCKSVHPGGCDAHHSAMLTACPECGAGTTQHRIWPNSSEIQVIPVAGPGGLRPARRPPMIKIR